MVSASPMTSTPPSFPRSSGEQPSTWKSRCHDQRRTRLDVLPVPFLVIPVLHLSGPQLMVHVVLGQAGPDLYVWDHGTRRHIATDPVGAAHKLGAYLHRPRRTV